MPAKIVTGHKCVISYHKKGETSEADFRLTIQCECKAELLACRKHAGKVILEFEHHCGTYPVSVLADVLPRIKEGR